MGRGTGGDGRVKEGMGVREGRQGEVGARSWVHKGPARASPPRPQMSPLSAGHQRSIHKPRTNTPRLSLLLLPHRSKRSKA